MKFWQAPSPAEATAALLLLATPAASMLKCEDMVADSHKFNLKPLGGPHSVTVSHMAGGSYHNTTYTVDLCASLRWKSDVDKTHQCPQNTRVCAVERLVGTGDNKFNAFSDVFPVAGDLRGRGGQPLDHELVNLRTSNSHEDSKKEGVLVILKGGFHDVNEQRRPQRTIIEVVCEPDKEGTEGEWKAEGDYVPGDPAQERAISTATNPLFYVSEEEGGKGDDDDAKPDKPVQVGDTANQALLFNSYGPLETNSDTDVLRLTWKTKYACESASTPGGGGKDQASSHWGFFTWLVILVFLGTAAYLIFGSWLNYNRYGARGWDLLPHGDTIRDIPYLMKDWTRRVLNTVQGSGSRGGYSAV